MNLFWHLLVHFLFGLSAGLISWKIYGYLKISLLVGILFGFFVDLDHFIDYFLAFGWSFGWDSFFSGAQFSENDRMYVFFHAWEYVLILFLLLFLIRSKVFKAIIFSAALGLFFHLTADVIINNIPVKNYSLIYRISNNFDFRFMVDYNMNSEKVVFIEEKKQIKV